MRRHAVVDSPIGPLTLVEQDGALAGLHLDGRRHAPESVGPRQDEVLPGLREQLDGYFRGELREIDVPLALAGTPFQLAVWSALCAIPYGTTRTYGELAADVGRPTAARAVGAASGRNPVCLVVPCHRAVGAGGALTGYVGGLERKALLLALEGQRGRSAG